MKCLIAALVSVFVASTTTAQFITPDYRTTDGDVDFAYWDFAFVPYTSNAAPPFAGLNSSQVNFPGVGGNSTARLAQYGSADTFVSGSGSLYSGNGTNAFRAYDNPTYSPGSILFQTETLVGSNSNPDISTVRLFYRENENDSFVEASLPLSAAVNSSNSRGNEFTAWEWNTTSLNIADYYIQFFYGDNHSSFRRAQLDTNETFSPQIAGFGVNVNIGIPFDFQFGRIEKSPERSIYNAGESVTLEADLNADFRFVKWVGPFGESTENPFTFVVTEETNVELIAAPVDYGIWRQISFPTALTGEVNVNDLWPSNIDYDGDGLLNAVEYAIGSDPESGLQEKRILREIVVIGEQAFPAIIFPQQFAATDLSYTVALSADLETWFTNDDPGGPYTAQPEVLSIENDGTQQVRVRSLIPIDTASPMPFLRLNLSLN